MNQTLTRTLRLLSALALAAALLVPSGTQAQTAQSTLLGTWNASTGAFRQVTIAGSPGAYTIRIKASCSPTPCDWGTRPLTIYAPSAGTATGKVGSATYNQGFATRIVIVSAQDAVAPFLKLEVYTTFTGGGRSNYVTTQTFSP
jgi:hypothetical protein